MTDALSETGFIFETSLEVWLSIRPGAGETAEWQDFDQGPGRFVIPTGFDACVRIKNIDNSALQILVTEIAACLAVTCLNLAENRKVTDVGLSRIAGLTQLTILNLSSCDITDRGMVWLKELKKLRVLNLSFCNRLSEAGLKHLRGLKSLTYLDLQGLPRINHAAVLKTVSRRGLTIHS